MYSVALHDASLLKKSRTGAENHKKIINLRPKYRISQGRVQFPTGGKVRDSLDDRD